MSNYNREIKERLAELDDILVRLCIADPRYAQVLEAMEELYALETNTL